MKFCINCGKQIKDDAKFCPFCGAVQPAVAPQAVAADEPVEENVVEAVAPVEEAPIEEVPAEPTMTTEEPVQAPVEEAPVQAAPAQAAPVQETPVEPARPAVEYVQPQPQAAPQGQPGVPVNPTPQPQAATQSSPQMDAVMAHGKNYFSFLNKNVVHPDMQAVGNDFNGLINAVLISLFTVAGGTHLLREVISYLFATKSGKLSTSPFPGFFEVFLWVACGFAVQMLVVFVFSSQIVHKPITILGALNKIFAPASVAVYVSAAFFLLSFLLEMSQPMFVIMLIPALIVNLAFAGAIWDISGDLTPGNRFYSVMATFLANAVISFIVGKIFLSILSSKVDAGNIMDQVFSQLFQ